MERGTERDDGGPRKENAGPLESRSFQSNCLRACWPLLLSYILSRPLEWKGRKGGTRRTTRAIEKEKEVERGRASERDDDDDGASEDAGKDEKLPLSSGGVVLVVVVVVLVGGLAAASASVALPSFFSFSSFLLRRKWPLDVTVIILRASLARKNERTRARERERESGARKMPVGGKGRRE